METLLLMLPGFVFLQLMKNEKRKSEPDYFEGNVALKSVDGWLVVLQASALSLIFFVAPSFFIKVVAAVLHSFGVDVLYFRDKIHLVVGDRYVLTYLVSIALAISPLYKWKSLANFLQSQVDRFVPKPIPTPYQTIINQLFGSFAFVKTKNGNYIIGVIDSAGISLKDDQLSIYPHYVGSRRKLDSEEVKTYNDNKDAKYPPVVADKEYLVFDVKYPVDNRLVSQCTLFFYKMSDVEYISQFHGDIHEYFKRSGETIELFSNAMLPQTVLGPQLQ